MITQVIAWGSNENKNLNLPNSAEFLGKTNFSSGLYGVKKVVAGAQHSVALMEWGEVIAWGSGQKEYDYGQSKIPQYFDFTPIDIATDQYTTYILGDNGVVTGYGQMYAYRMVPKLTGIKSISVNAGYGVAVTNQDKVTGWGYDFFDIQDNIKNLTDVKKVSAGLSHVAIMLNNNNLIGFGDNSYGQLDFPSSLEDVYDIYASEYSTITFHNTEGSGIQIWGKDSNFLFPSGLTEIVDIDINNYHGLMLTKCAQSCGFPPNKIPSCQGQYFFDTENGLPIPNPPFVPANEDINTNNGYAVCGCGDSGLPSV